MNEALEAIEEVSIQTSQGSYVKVEDVKRLLGEKADHLEAELKDRIEKRVPYRMRPDQARRMAMRDEELRERHSSPGPREPGKSIPAGPVANEGVKS